MPNPPKPIELKKKQGTYRPDRDPSRGRLHAVQPLDRALVDQSADAVLAAVLEAGVPWLSNTDAPVVAVLRDALADYADMAAAGYPPKELREARAEIVKMLSTLGFDPTARARLGLAEIKAESKLDQLRARREAGNG